MNICLLILRKFFTVDCHLNNRCPYFSAWGRSQDLSIFVPPYPPSLAPPAKHPKMRFYGLLIAAAAALSTAVLATQSMLDPVTWLAIKSTVDAFSMAVDTRPVPTFEHIFTKDADLNLTIAGSQQIGIDAINAYFNELLTGYETQHSFGTQQFELSADGQSAIAITKFIGTFWDTTGDVALYVTHFNQYNDTLVLVDGEWLISKKRVTFLVGSLRKAFLSHTIATNKFPNGLLINHRKDAVCRKLHPVGNVQPRRGVKEHIRGWDCSLLGYQKNSREIKKL